MEGSAEDDSPARMSAGGEREKSGRETLWAAVSCGEAA
jgi:hypothetical protein